MRIYINKHIDDCYPCKSKKVVSPVKPYRCVHTYSLLSSLMKNVIVFALSLNKKSLVTFYNMQAIQQTFDSFSTFMTLTETCLGPVGQQASCMPAFPSPSALFMSLCGLWCQWSQPRSVTWLQGPQGYSVSHPSTLPHTATLGRGFLVSHWQYRCMPLSSRRKFRIQR